MELPPFRQPPKPAVPNLRALELLVKRPESQPENTLLLTREFVVAYDLYPKAAVHLLILPRDTELVGEKRPQSRHKDIR